MSVLADTPINPLTLTFTDPPLESDFRADGRTKSLGPLRLSLAAGLALHALMGFLDPWVAAETYETYRAIWLIRYAVVCPLFAGMLLLSFAPFFRRFESVILGVGAGCAGWGLILIAFAVYPSGSDLYLTFLCLHLIFSCLLLRLRFPAALALSGAVAAGFLLLWLVAAAPTRLPWSGVAVVASAALGLAMAYGLDRSRRADFLQRRNLGHQADELSRARQEVESLTRVDPLTGLSTREHFFELAERDLERCRRYAHPLAIIKMDLDHFKVVNATVGRVTGDQVLRAVARQIQVNVREVDSAGRYGGEEFVVVLPETDCEAALQVGERLRSFIESLRVDTALGRLSVTVSVGVAATADRDTITLDDLIDRADKALLAAKQAGRNRVSDGGA